MPAGRPSDYNEELGNRIAEALETAKCGLATLCRQREDFPHPATVFEWMRKYPEFGDKITHAREVLFENLLHGGLTGIDDVELEDETDPRLANARVSRAKASADARFKLAGKILPRKYGDKVEVDLPKDTTINVTTAIMKDPNSDG